MRSEIKASPQEETPIEFPCLRLGKYTGNMYLFTENNKCTLVWNEGINGKALGARLDLDVQDTRHFHGVVTLSN